MERPGLRVSSHRSWWLVFGLLIAAPAVALALLGLKVIRADEIERAEWLRNERLRTVKALDAALDAALSQATGIDVALDRSGVIRFPQSRVYFGPFGVTPVDAADAPGAERTPSGLPRAVVTAITTNTRPAVIEALESLRAGQWWLSVEQRKAYDQELRTMLRGIGGQPVTDTHVVTLERLEGLVRSAVTRMTPSTRAALLPDDMLLIWRGSDNTNGVRPGVILEVRTLATHLDSVAASVTAPANRPASIVDGNNGVVWGATPARVSTWETFPAVPGWRAAFDQAEGGGGTRRRLLLYSLVFFVLLVLGAGLVMTALIVRQEIALAALRSQFISAVTHEFKSPLTSMRLVLERLTSGRVANTDPSSRYYAALTTEVDRLEGLVNRLLASQKFQAGQKVLTPLPTSIRSLVQAAVSRVTPLADAKGIRINIESEADVPEIDLDRESVTDAIGNLLDNAIKYSPTNTHILVEMKAADGHLAVAVTDEGIGIDPADASKVFDAFFRSPRGDRTNVHGTGLGLFLVKACAEGHGGTVEVSSNGHGSRFTMRFPCPEVR